MQAQPSEELAGTTQFNGAEDSVLVDVESQQGACGLVDFSGGELIVLVEIDCLECGIVVVFSVGEILGVEEGGESQRE